MEGSAIVGKGLAKEIFQHKLHGKNDCRVLYPLEFI